MPVRLESPMLSVDAERMRNVDTRNVENLFGMWSDHTQRFNARLVFSKCAESMENGRRLENLSWRIWNRETLCCEIKPQFTNTHPVNITRSRPRRKDVPELSTSVDSLSSEDSDPTEESPSSPSQPTSPLDIRTASQRSPPTTMAASRADKHITSLGLEKMVCSIKDKQDIGPLSPSIAEVIPVISPSSDITPRPTSTTLTAPFPSSSSDSSSSTADTSSPESDKSTAQTVNSDTSEELATSHSVVRGFSPNQISSSYRSHTHLAPTPIPTKPMMPSKTEPSKKGGMFTLGGGSSGEEDSSFEERMSSQPKQSSLTAELKRPHGTKKTLSFRDEVESRQLNNKSHEDEGVFESSDEEDMQDSAIDSEEEDEDDDEDWEDDASESQDNSSNTPMFQRVDSKPNLVSRRSLLTTMMTEGDRAAAFENLASRSTPAIRRSRTSKGSPSVGLPAEDDSSDNAGEPSVPMLGPHMTRSKPIIMTTSNNVHQMALSPRTTRRNMLSTEMTESLRKHVLWERQQKKATANAVLKRRHTAHNLVNLQNHPGQDPARQNNSWNFGPAIGEYHQVGW
ncbi:hypothetical protein ACLMJK_007894 [Lecanora helva]